MNNSINETTTDLANTIADIVEFALFTLIFFLAVAYIILILTDKTFRSNKLNWPTVNICLATALFSLYEFIFIITGLKEVSIMSCRLEGFLIDMAVFHMMYAYCVSSFIRLLAIRYFHKPLFRSSRWLLVNMVIGWIIGILVALPFVFYDGFFCPIGGFTMGLKIYSCFIVLIIPIHIVTLCNASIFWFIYKISRRVHCVNNNRSNIMSRKRDAHVSKIMFLTFCLFVIGWTPVFVEELSISAEHSLPEGVSIFFVLLLLSSLLGNIILIIYANQPVRQRIKQIFKCNGRILYVIEC